MLPPAVHPTDSTNLDTVVVQSLECRKEGPGRYNESAVEIVAEVRAMAWEWTKARGPVSGWSSCLMSEFEAATRNSAIQELEKEWRAHRGVGLALVKSLHDVVGSWLPQDERVLRDIVQQAFDLATTLLAGTAAIDAHLTLLGMAM